jgi:hypothetical protein
MTRDENDVVRVYAGPLVLVEAYQTTLTEAGIDCKVVGTELSGSFGSALPESVELWVHRLDLPRATALIEKDARPKSAASHDRPQQHFPHPTDAPKPAAAPLRKEPYVNPNPGG